MDVGENRFCVGKQFCVDVNIGGKYLVPAFVLNYTVLIQFIITR